MTDSTPGSPLLRLTAVAVNLEEARDPALGEIQLVLLRDDARFVAWLPAADLPAILEAVERRWGLTTGARTDELTQARLRMSVDTGLGDRATALAAFTGHLAATALWLVYHHHARSGALRAGLDGTVGRVGFAVVTVGIGRTARSAPGTAWVIAIDAAPADLRPALESLAPGVVQTVHGWQGPSSTGDAGDRT